MKVFSKEELKLYDGRTGVILIAVEGKVYDVSRSYQWRQGVHQVMHRAGQDLTKDLDTAPHGPDVMEKYPVIGVLIDDQL